MNAFDKIIKDAYIAMQLYNPSLDQLKSINDAKTIYSIIFRRYPMVDNPVATLNFNNWISSEISLMQ